LTAASCTKKDFYTSPPVGKKGCKKAAKKAAKKGAKKVARKVAKKVYS